MAQTDVQIINNGLSIIGSSRISRINPPKTAIEQFMEASYPQWRESELTKRRWVFATEQNYVLTINRILSGVQRPFVYNMPADCLRPIRLKCSEWQQIGRTIRSALNNLKIDYVRKVDTADFDPLFRDVLAARVAQGSVEFITQSNTKAQKADLAYSTAVNDAAAVNAFVLGPEDIQSDDADFSWLQARYNGFHISRNRWDNV